MSKKDKRQTTRSASSASAVSTSPTSSGTAGRAFEREFNPDYSYVVKDLRRIGALAGSFFVVLVLLSFFLR